MIDKTKKTPMAQLDPVERSKTFGEVALGYTKEEAMQEAARCLQCKNRTCVSGCPVMVQIPEFLKLITEGKFIEAADKIKETNSLPAVCGRVCPQETQCEGKCVRGIKGESVAIGRLERFAADYAAAHSKPTEKKTAPANAKKVAVVGSGPAGLSCAGELAKRGYSVTVFEAFHKSGGVLVYGIPEFRLPKEIVKREIAGLEANGVEIRTNAVIGRTFLVDELFEDGYEAVFIGSGAGLPNFMGIEGEALVGVYSANEYLTRVNLMKAYDNSYVTPIRKSKSVAVIGGGNVAMDAARCAKRLGAENVYIIYRRSEEEMPARREEVEHAKEEGIIFKLLCNPNRFVGNEKGELIAVDCVEMELGEPDASGRRRPVEKADSEFRLDIDTAVIAVGTTPNPLIRSTTEGLDTNKRGCIVVAEGTTKTSRENVFAGGDVVTGAATVILAMGAGRDSAAEIDEMLKAK
ncbi:MAG: glutamate synthase (NADPH), homotetrameric [Clostridiales bacterium GWF2_38_85]|nr:MAG: glutamate synthase (NADPH), homotetrameric [Clostridiales bacterium GWF2_38_85]HBL84414.1 glutamate synthase (NADPH), homotetrameric [Clostridiales bacterium]